MYSCELYLVRVAMLNLQARADRHWALTARTYALHAASGNTQQLRTLKHECQKAQALSERIQKLFRIVFPSDKSELDVVMDDLECQVLVARHDALMEKYEARVNQLEKLSRSEKLLGLARCRGLLKHAETVIEAANRHRASSTC